MTGSNGARRKKKVASGGMLRNLLPGSKMSRVLIGPRVASASTDWLYAASVSIWCVRTS